MTTKPNNTAIREKIERVLEVPLTRIVDYQGKSYELFLNGLNIGKLPYFQFGGIQMYDTDEAVLNNFKWEFIFQSYFENIKHSIITQVGPKFTYITLSTWRKLYLRESESGDNVLLVSCAYDGKEWQITRLD